MEYKIGQRVKCRGKEGCLIHYCVDDDYWHIDINGQVENCYDTTELSPLYLPGDQVRVTATEEELADIALDGIVTEGSIIAVGGYIEGGWIHFGGWNIGVKCVEWYSGVEDKPDSSLIHNKPKRQQDIYTGPKLPNDLENWLPAEVHQDKDRNKAVMAEVLDHKPYYRIQYKCLRWEKDNCGFTGSQTEVQEHMKDFHKGESVPAFTSRFWDSLKVK